MAMCRTIMGRGKGFISSFSFLLYQNTSRNYASTPSSILNSSLKAAEAAKFAAIADKWWDYEGPYKPLHLMNPTRISFIRSALCQHFRKDPNNARPFEGLRIIDIGCGGGLLSEPLARMGAQVTGIDALEKNISIASVHTVRDPLTASIDYRCSTAEQLVQEEERFDAVISLEVKSEDERKVEKYLEEENDEDVEEVDVEEELHFAYDEIERFQRRNSRLRSKIQEDDESKAKASQALEEAEKIIIDLKVQIKEAKRIEEVIEHVANPQEFCKSLAALTIDNGAIFISTINRTIRSYITAIVAAEYILGWLPRGTHDWSNLITPNELVLLMKHASIMVQEMAGLTYDPLRQSWKLSDNTDVNYISFGVKQDT